MLNLTFEMYTDDSLDTSILIDDVLFETAKGGAPNEGNDTVESATSATLGQEMSDLSINPALDKDSTALTRLRAALSWLMSTPLPMARHSIPRWIEQKVSSE